MEVLVALAIAAMMAAMLVRFLANTRANAARLSEALEMATIAETLLARVASLQPVQPGRTDGRSGNFLWRIEVQPTAFTAFARKVQAREVQTSDDGEKTGIGGRSPAGPAPAKTSTNEWLAYRVVVVVAAPSGRKHVADTIRIGPVPVAVRR